MIFGIGLTVFGYAVFYWGVHHFSGWDCPTKDGCRYGLLELLGVPKSWKIAKYPTVSLNVPPDTNTQNQKPENQTTPNGLTGGNNWISGILQGLSAPNSNNNVNKLNAWNACEGNLSGHSGLGINNPFNTTLDCCNGQSVNSAGVKSYPTMTAGIQATLQTLNAGRYSAIVSNLKSDGSFSAFANAVGSSGWGTSGSCIAGKGVSVSTV